MPGMSNSTERLRLWLKFEIFLKEGTNLIRAVMLNLFQHRLHFG